MHDICAIRGLLEVDRAWAAYPLGDLAPGFFDHCSWFQPQGGSALALLYRAVNPPVLFAQGNPESLATILNDFSTEPAIYLHVRPEMLPVLAMRYRIVELRRMWRMVLGRNAQRVAPSSDVARLSSSQQSAVEQLYSDGDGSAERPDFFFPSMLDEGVFYGLWEDGQLVAVAGTHLVVPREDVAAVGNVYTRRDRRRLGLAATVTSAVIEELLRMRIRTIVLNVNQSNASAIHVYERLGFTRHCSYCEGLAERLAAYSARSDSE
ncbi:MAG: mycothiol synthase [Bryobacterales bacterium]|nr:mycothiol synthase [Bryobacterales bacterium]